MTPDESSLEPGGETTLSVIVKDASGNPVPDAELAVVVVDEAILALTNYQTGRPAAVFSTRTGLPIFRAVYGRASIILADPQALAAAGRDRAAARKVTASGAFLAGAPAATMPRQPRKLRQWLTNVINPMGRHSRPSRVRSDFNPLATFAPTVRTGANGEARVSVKLPDNLTRYRIMVVAVDSGGKQFGTGESNLTARLPLMVRPSAPRFLNFGDKFELPVVLQNQTDSPHDGGCGSSAPPTSNSGMPGMRVTVPANDRVEVRFPAVHDDGRHGAHPDSQHVSGKYADAATVELPVYTPATSEAFATYGVIDEGALAQPVLYPTGVFPQYGGLEINTSSTALQALTDAVLYLVAYPFECSEQLASRILAVASLRDVLTAFEADGLPSPDEMEVAVDRDIERLQGLQN